MTTTAYRTLFQDYLGAGLQLVLAQVQAAEPLVPDDLRRQAWHLLSYAFESDAAWPHTRSVLLAMSPKMEQAGFRNEWVPYLEQGRKYALAYNDQQCAAECELNIGHLLRLQGLLNDAYEILLTSVDRFVLIGERRGEARVRNQLAYLHCLQHRYEEATTHAQQALAIPGQGEEEQAMSHFVLGMVAIDLGHWRDAVRHHQCSLVLREAQGDRRRIAWSLQNVGFALRGLGQASEAISYFQRAAQLLDDLQDRQNLAITLLNLGIAHHQTGNTPEALLLHEKAYSIFETLHDRVHLAKITTSLGVEHLVLGNLSQAEQAFLASIQYYADLVDISWRLNATDGLAMVYLAQQRYTEASVLLLNAIGELPVVVNQPNYAYLSNSMTQHLRTAQEGLAATEWVTASESI